jgi:hypothetical protein
MEPTTTTKKKRVSKKKTEVVTQEEESKENIQIVMEDSKKRGRKPKGGKLIPRVIEPVVQKDTIANIILHLKCSLKDLDEYNTNINKMIKNPLNYDPSVPPEIRMYNDDKTDLLKYDTIAETCNVQPLQSGPTYAYKDNLCSQCSKGVKPEVEQKTASDDDYVNMKDVNTKLRSLKVQLYKNLMHDKKSACFWCTYEFDNPACYIPKYEMYETIFAYGSFCRPECAVAYLMKENIDDSTKFERYHLLNQIYSKIYDFKKNIKPAPNPYYLLDKFYGNLTIQEYRKLLKTEHMLLVIEKPLTRILPELHEDNEDMMLSANGGNQPNGMNGVYKVKRQSEKQQGPSKASIIRDTFGLA